MIYYFLVLFYPIWSFERLFRIRYLSEHVFAELTKDTNIVISYLVDVLELL